jgi:hypothetical protein
MLLEFWRSFFFLFNSTGISLCIIFKPLALHMRDQIIMHKAVLEEIVSIEEELL